MIQLPILSPAIAPYFCQALQNYAFLCCDADANELPPELRTPLPSGPSDLTPPRLVECNQLPRKQDVAGLRIIAGRNPPLLQPRVERVGIVPNPLDVEHGRAPSRSTVIPA